jgi:hypothetical protein
MYDNMFAYFRAKESEEEYAQRTRRVPSAVDEPSVAKIPTESFHKTTRIIPGIVIVEIVVVHCASKVMGEN